MVDESDFVDRAFTDFSNRELETFIETYTGPGKPVDDLENFLLKTYEVALYDQLTGFGIDLARVYGRTTAPISKETGEALEANALMEPSPIRATFERVTKSRLAGLLADIKTQTSLPNDLRERIDDMCNSLSITNRSERSGPA